VHIGFDHNVDSADAIELNFIILVVSPITHARHVFAVRLVFLVAWLVCEKTFVRTSGSKMLTFSKDDIFVQSRAQSSALV